MTTTPRSESRADDFLRKPNLVRRLAAALHALLPERVRHVVRPAAQMVFRPLSPPDECHPERLAVLPLLAGTVLEVGCGHRKTVASALAVDIVPGGQRGRVGNAKGRRSEGDVCASGNALPFPAASFDTVLARHNLEHYVDTIQVLEEWRRILRPCGRLVVVVPDEENYGGRTVELDPTHFHAFTRASLARLVQLAGYRVCHVETAVPRWSFLLVASTSPEGPAVA